MKDRIVYQLPPSDLVDIQPSPSSPSADQLKDQKAGARVAGDYILSLRSHDQACMVSLDSIKQWIKDHG